MDLGIKGRVALVGGASAGLGWAIAQGLAAEGARVAICARSEAGLQVAATQIAEQTGSMVLPVCVDVEHPSQIEQAILHVREELGPIEILVNNAGGPPEGDFCEVSASDWQVGFQRNFLSLVTFCQGVIPDMRERGWGRIVNVASMSARQPLKGMVVSNALRTGVLGLTKTLSNELAHHGILVNALLPGWTMTHRVRELAQARARKEGQEPEVVVSGWESSIPLGRLAQPAEIADVAVFLCCARASYLTGQAITVDGGFIKGI